MHSGYNLLFSLRINQLHMCARIRSKSEYSWMEAGGSRGVVEEDTKKEEEQGPSFHYQLYFHI